MTAYKRKTRAATPRKRTCLSVAAASVASVIAVAGFASGSEARAARGRAASFRTATDVVPPLTYGTEPRTIQLSGDGSLVAFGLKWIVWKRNGGLAVGQVEYKTGSPYKSHTTLGMIAIYRLRRCGRAIYFTRAVTAGFGMPAVFGRRATNLPDPCRHPNW